MPETAFHEAPLAQEYRACSEGKKVDIVGVTGSSPVMPTIQPHKFQCVAGKPMGFALRSLGSLNLGGCRDAV